jgi:phage portal protein BeeE
MSSYLDKVLEESRLKRQAHRNPPRGTGPARASAAMSSPQAGSSGLGRDQVSSYQDFYRYNRDIVYACVRVIYKRCSGQPFRLAKTGDKAVPMERRVAKDYLPGHLKSLHARVDVLDGHPFLDLLDRPNPVMVRSTLLQMTVASLEITGRSYWWMGGDKDPSNWSILPLPAHWVEPVHRPGMLYARWKVHIPGSSDDIEVPGDEIAYFYYPDPSNPLASLSPLQAASQAILTGESIDNSHRQAFNMGIGGSVVVKVARTAGVAGQDGSRAELGRAQREQLMRAFMEHYAGVLKQNYPIILDGIFEDVKRINQSNKEMDFLQSKKLTNQIICMIFGVNPIVLGMLESANRSSSATAEDHLCHDAETECLTKSGWKKYHELTTETEVACYEPATGSIVYHRPEQVVVYDHDGPMHRWQGQCLSALMTPSHRCWVQTREKPGENRRAWSFREASDLATTTFYRIKTCGTAIGVAPTEGIRLGENCVLDPEVFCDLVGWFVSEGHHTTKPAGIAISQAADSPHAPTIAALFERIGLPFIRTLSHNECQWIIWGSKSPGLAASMREWCGGYSHEKKIPDFVKAWPARLLARVLDAACDGDAHVKSDVTRSYATNSRQLADDIQEIAVKCGWRASISPRAHDSRPGRRQGWVVNLHRTDERTLAAANRAVEYYVGKVWCVTVPTGLFLVRRNGSVHVSGNCNNVVNPILILLGEVINAQVLPFFVGDGGRSKNGQSGVTGYFEPAHAYDPDLDQSRLKLLFQTGGARVNEARTQLGFPPVPGGHVAWRPQNVEPYNLDEEFDFTPPEDATGVPPPVPDIFGGANAGAPGGAPTPAVPAAPERNGTAPTP